MLRKTLSRILLSRKTLFQLHWFFGVSAGFILSIMGITGALYSYDDEILQTLNPDSFYVEAQQAPRLTPVEIYQRMNQRFPDYKVSTIQLGQATDADIVTLTKEKQTDTYYLNPYTGAQLPTAKGEALLNFVLDVHRTLTLGEFGKQLTGASTLILLFFIFSGLYLRWPSQKKLLNVKEWLSIRWQLKGRSFLWYFHAVMGTWVLLFYLLISLTGLYWSYDWYREGLFKVMGVESPAEKEKHAAMNKMLTAKPMSSTTMKQNAAPSTADMARGIDQSWQAFQHLVPNYSKVNYRLQRGKGKTIEILYLDAVPSSSFARNSIKYDIKQLKVESHSRYDDKPLNEKIMSSILPIHRGIFFGPIWQLMTLLAALCMPAFFVTGWMMYVKRRQQKKLMQAKRPLKGYARQ